MLYFAYLVMDVTNLWRRRTKVVDEEKMFKTLFRVSYFWTADLQDHCSNKTLILHGMAEMQILTVTTKALKLGRLYQIVKFCQIYSVHYSWIVLAHTINGSIQQQFKFQFNLIIHINLLRQIKLYKLSFKLSKSAVLFVHLVHNLSSGLDFLESSYFI